MVVALLGVLKAGGAYVPLDPNQPTDRLAYMLSDAAPRLLLTQARLRGKLPASPTEVVELDNDWSAIAPSSADNLTSENSWVGPKNVAYVIYTSGSTGKPKGVMVEQQNVSRLLAATEMEFNFNEQDVWTLFHSYSFDFSVWEIWGALLYGARLVVVPYETARSADDFYRLLCREGVTVLNQTPGAFMQLIEAQSRVPGRKNSLRLVIFGGEALELHRLAPWVGQNGADEPLLVNMYGITETTVHVTHHALTAGEVESEPGSVVGKPICDLRLYLLDGNRQLVPFGVIGEIYVGGGGVARGYLNLPTLTAERFLPDPFSSDPLDRIYKSGDLGRLRADGMLEYMGRNDDQVKIRGFRVELGEIDAQLAKHEQIREAVVLAREDTPGEKRLVAYVTGCGGDGPRADDLREYLRQRLPDYMVPSAFVVVDKFPLTSNGKLDRRALPAPDLDAFARGQYEAPRGEVEEVLADIWRDLLRVERVGRRDSFFDLGGHSLLATRVISRISHVLDVDLPLQIMFEKPTIEGLGNRIFHEIVAEASARDL
jgi:amino acid adenylation domain-containing protein